MAGAQLRGIGVWMTQSRGVSPGVQSGLIAHGAELLPVPLIVIKPRKGPRGIATGFGAWFAGLGEAAVPGAGLVVTSANAAALLGPAAAVSSLRDAFLALPAFCIGSGSASAMRDAGFAHVEGIEPPSAEVLCNHIVTASVSSLWFPRAAKVAFDIAKELGGRGIQVTESILYDTVPSASSAVSEMVERCVGGLDTIVVVASGEGITSLRRALEDRVGSSDLPSSCKLVCVGRSSVMNARELGLPVAAVASSPGDNDLVAAVLSVVGRDGMQENITVKSGSGGRGLARPRGTC